MSEKKIQWFRKKEGKKKKAFGVISYGLGGLG